MSRFGSLVLVALLVAALAATAGCGTDPKRQYAEATVAIMNEWHAIIDRWNANPGDAQVATDFAALAARAKAITAPKEMQQLHERFVSAIDAEQRSFELWALGKKQESAALHAQVLKTIDEYTQALRNLGFVK